jgi:alpha-beta hydrolase superfamily lysophospholipase
MHRWSAVLLAGLCAVPVAAHAQVRSGGFVASRDGKEISRERYRFDGSTLEADVELVDRGIRLSTRTEYTPALSPARYRLAAHGGGGRAPVQELDAAFGDSVRWTGRSVGVPASGASGIRRPYATMQNLVFSQLAAILLRYSRPAGGVQVLDVWNADAARVMQLRMQFRGDSGTVEVGNTSIRVTTDRDGWLRSASVPAQRINVSWKPDVTLSALSTGAADTVPPPRVRESAFPVTSGALRLTATLAAPEPGGGRIPVAVIVSASGGVDRNGNAPRGLRANTYAQLAWRLAERGIATVRYDSRWVAAGQSGPGPDSVTVDDLAADLAAVVRAAVTDPRFGPVVVIGHSEGGFAALRAGEGSLRVDGIALLATPARALSQSLASFDPVSAIARVRVPLLIVQGGVDGQVPLRDAQRLRGGHPAAQLAIIPQANHLFKAPAGPDRLVQLALYRDPTVPVVPDLVTTLGTWIEGLARP